jgi:glycosyltransferase involved in cell wall biosynthesis
VKSSFTDSFVKDMIPVSAVIATVERTHVLKRTLLSILAQTVKPAELIIIDASEGDHEEEIASCLAMHPAVSLIYKKAKQKGAATQRVEGITLSAHDVIWFMDDDILLEPECAARLWTALHSSPQVGAVNAMITNQHYTKPGKVTSLMYRVMSGKSLPSYAGKVIGPAWNLLPEDGAKFSEYAECEWLNTTCTMYRRERMPQPVFPRFFSGYSPFEDLALSATMHKRFALLNVPSARIFHDSQSGAHKTATAVVARMALVNRYYVMNKILERTRPADFLKLVILETFMLISGLKTRKQFIALPAILWGKLLGVAQILTGRW